MMKGKTEILYMYYTKEMLHYIQDKAEIYKCKVLRKSCAKKA
jgi:hypothetical protein